MPENEILAPNQRKARRKRSLQRQIIGADNADFGYEYQLFVALLELVVVARRWVEGDIGGGSVVRQGRTPVDDVHVTADDHLRVIQVKGGDKVSWEHDLVCALWSEYRIPAQSGSKSIEVCVGSADLRLKMEGNKLTGRSRLTGERHNLHFVEVICVPDQWRFRPYLYPAVFNSLELLTIEDWHDDLMGSVWYYFHRAFVESRYKGDVQAILLEVDRMSRYTTRFPDHLSIPETYHEFVDKLNNNIEQLLFATDGSKLIVSNGDDEELSQRPSVYPLLKYYRALKDKIPETFDEFQAVARTLGR
ncbi:hypothetical protein [Agrobacterium burrii]|uniref:DUF4365 domain-containing protein n=1 Tax=Agrobacterium burrii TaxID=2815339 RepID=A0ABS3EJS1_9HYPH|nr:hypothetical protein [Agrobacterium burrii]MBO0132210.1 hypothetical protein [Agrobacterium burrii]